MRRTVSTMAWPAALTMVACNAAFGIDDLRYEDVAPATGGAGGVGGGAATGAGGSSSCDEGDERPCYGGPPATGDVGICQPGIERCVDGAWSTCEGQVVPDEESCATTGDENCDGFECGELLWAQTIGDAGRQYVRDIAVAGDGAFVAVGTYDGDLSLDLSLPTKGDDDGFVAGFDPDGNLTDLTVVTGTSYANAVALAPNGDRFVAGAFSGDLDIGGRIHFGAAGPLDGYVARLSPAGQVLWIHRIGGGQGESVFALDHHPSGGLYVGGYFSSGALEYDGNGLGVGGAADADAFVIRLDESDGSPIWARSYGNANGDATQGLSAHPGGGVFLALEVSGGADLGLPNQGATDGAIVRLDGSGDPLWARAFGGGSEDDLIDVAHHQDGLVVAVGSFQGSIDFDGATLDTAGHDVAVIALDEDDGSVVWVSAISSTGTDAGSAVDVDAAGRIYAGGAYEGALRIGGFVLPDSSGRRSPFVARLMSDGSVDYAFGWLANAVPTQGTSIHGRVALGAGDAGSLVFGGSFDDDIDFGDGPLPSAGSTDAFLGRLAP